MTVRSGFQTRSLARGFILLGIAAFWLVSPAAADGINLSWNDCGDSGTPNLTVDCAAGGSPLVLIASFVPPQGVGQFLGLSSELQISASAPQLPDWWKHGIGQCRGSAGLSVSFDFTSGPSSCADLYGGLGAGGLAYDVAFGSPSNARLRIQAAIPIDNMGPIDPGTEYYAYRLSIARGSASCSGCQSPMCVVLRSIQLFQPPEDRNDPEITRTASRSYVTWQAAGSDHSGCGAGNVVGSKSWGQLKTIYR